jgi:xylulokinase
MYQPQNGWAEQDPEDWWEAVQKTLSIISQKATDGRIAGIGLSGQMHSLVLLDQSNKVIRPAILWCDQRTARECAEIEDRIGREKLIEITANPALTGFTASKLLWVQKHEPENFARCAHILLAKDYIRFKLTGEYATEVSDASGMQLLDVPARKWSREICDALQISTDLLATVYESPDITGYITKEAALVTGLPAGIPVAGGAGDNAASAIGTSVCAEGDAFTTIGTSGVVFAPTKSPIIDPQGRVHTFCAAVPGTWHVMGVTQAAGLSLNWFRSRLSKELSYREIDEGCKNLPIGAEKLLYLPYLMGERTPILDPNARGVFLGLSAMHTKAHLARAVMEGVSYSLRDCLEILGEMKIEISRMTLCGGGAKSALWQQMLSDVYGISVNILDSNEGAALGAAILGGCAAGVFSSVEEGCKACIHGGTRIDPNANAHAEYDQFYGIYRSIYPQLKNIFAELKEI